MELRRMQTADAPTVLAAGHLFDRPPTLPLTERFLRREGHHLVVAFVEDRAAGFITGVEVDHPDKPTEMMLYELGVDDPFRRQGIGRALVGALFTLAEERGCRGVWVPVEGGDDRAMAFYRSVRPPQQESAEILWWDVDPPGVAASADP